MLTIRLSYPLMLSSALLLCACQSNPSQPSITDGSATATTQPDAPTKTHKASQSKPKSASQKQTEQPSAPTVSETPATTEPVLANVPLDKAALMTHYQHWQGTPYQLGGVSRRGIDCSAFVATTFAELIDLQLPRTTEQQMALGQWIELDEMQLGDLIFFNMTPTTRHVGIYIGEQQFIHASYSQGVTISSIDNPYWILRFAMARRILPSG